MVGFWVIIDKNEDKILDGRRRKPLVLFIFYWLKLDLNPGTLIPKHDFHPSTQSEKVTNLNGEKTEN